MARFRAPAGEPQIFQGPSGTDILSVVDEGVVAPLLDIGGKEFHVDTFTGTDLEKWEAAIDAARADALAHGLLAGGRVVAGHCKLYTDVQLLVLYPGMRIDLNGSTLRRADNQLSFARIFTTVDGWDGAEDSPLTIVENGTLDGNRANQGPYDNYEREQQSCIFLDSPDSTGGRMRVALHNLVLQETAGDGIHVHRNIDLQASNLRTWNPFRAGIAVTGGNTRVQINGWTAGGTDYIDGLDVETDGLGYGDTYRVDLQITNAHIAGHFDIGARDDSRIQLTNVYLKQPGINFSARGSAVWQINNCSFAVGVATGSFNRVVAPGDMTLSNCEFVVTEAAESSEADNLLRALDVYFNIGSGTYSGQRVRLNDCVWKVASDVETGDTVTAVYVNPRIVGATDNEVIIKEPEIPSGYDVGLHMAEGGKATVRGGRILAATPVSASLSSTRPLDLTLDAVDVKGAGKLAHIATSHADSTIRLRRMVANEADAGITTGGTLVNTVYETDFLVMVDSSPVGRLTGIVGTVARLKPALLSTLASGAAYEWICSVTGHTAGGTTWFVSRTKP